TALGLKTGPFVKRDAALPSEYPSPSNIDLPFPGPNIIYGINDYPNVFPDPDGIGGPPSFMKGPASGPVELWTLVKPPSDVSADGVSVFNDHGRLTTINGMVSGVDAGTGEILWQRPAYDGIKGTIGTGQAFGTLTVGNGVVFIGYQDGKATMVALDAESGRKLSGCGRVRALTRAMQRIWTRLGPDGKPYASARRGTLGGHRGSRIYGRLDCPGALRAIARGCYVQSRVFFLNRTHARAAGYR